MGLKNDQWCKTSFIKAYLAAQAFVLTTVLLSSGRTPFSNNWRLEASRSHCLGHKAYHNFQFHVARAQDVGS